MDRGADLTTNRRQAGRAAGQVIHVMGRVVNVEDSPSKGYESSSAG